MSSGRSLMLGTALVILLDCVSGHGRLVEPPGRSSMWRYGYDTPVNYLDNQLFCGGYTIQWEKNEGKCGVCGDQWDGPRENEAGGKYANGIIVRRYKAGGTVHVIVDLTAPHKGFFEFRICPNNNPAKEVTHDCLDKHVLPLADGSGTRYYITSTTPKKYQLELQLPVHLECSQCVLQWKYNAGNNWGTDKNGRGCIGCGAQEQFYACADIAVGHVGMLFPPVEPQTTETSTLPSTVKQAGSRWYSSAKELTQPAGVNSPEEKSSEERSKVSEALISWMLQALSADLLMDQVKKDRVMWDIGNYGVNPNPYLSEDMMYEMRENSIDNEPQVRWSDSKESLNNDHYYKESRRAALLRSIGRTLSSSDILEAAQHNGHFAEFIRFLPHLQSAIRALPPYRPQPKAFISVAVPPVPSNNLNQHPYQHPSSEHLPLYGMNAHLKFDKKYPSVYYGTRGPSPHGGNDGQTSPPEVTHTNYVSSSKESQHTTTRKYNVQHTSSQTTRSVYRHNYQDNHNGYQGNHNVIDDVHTTRSYGRYPFSDDIITTRTTLPTTVAEVNVTHTTPNNTLDLSSTITPDSNVNITLPGDNATINITTPLPSFDNLTTTLMSEGSTSLVTTTRRTVLITTQHDNHTVSSRPLAGWHSVITTTRRHTGPSESPVVPNVTAETLGVTTSVPDVTTTGERTLVSAGMQGSSTPPAVITNTAIGSNAVAADSRGAFQYSSREVMGNLFSLGVRNKDEQESPLSDVLNVDKPVEDREEITLMSANKENLEETINVYSKLQYGRSANKDVNNETESAGPKAVVGKEGVDHQRARMLAKELQQPNATLSGLSWHHIRNMIDSASSQDLDEWSLGRFHHTDIGQVKTNKIDVPPIPTLLESYEQHPVQATLGDTPLEMQQFSVNEASPLTQPQLRVSQNIALPDSLPAEDDALLHLQPPRQVTTDEKPPPVQPPRSASTGAVSHNLEIAIHAENLQQASPNDGPTHVQSTKQGSNVAPNHSPSPGQASPAPPHLQPRGQASLNDAQPHLQPREQASLNDAPPHLPPPMMRSQHDAPPRLQSPKQISSNDIHLQSSMQESPSNAPQNLQPPNQVSPKHAPKILDPRQTSTDDVLPHLQPRTQHFTNEGATNLHSTTHTSPNDTLTHLQSTIQHSPNDRQIRNDTQPHHLQQSNNEPRQQPPLDLHFKHDQRIFNRTKAREWIRKNILYNKDKTNPLKISNKNEISVTKRHYYPTHDAAHMYPVENQTMEANKSENPQQKLRPKTLYSNSIENQDLSYMLLSGGPDNHNVQNKDPSKIDALRYITQKIKEDKFDPTLTKDETEYKSIRRQGEQNDDLSEQRLKNSNSQDHSDSNVNFKKAMTRKPVVATHVRNTIISENQLNERLFGNDITRSKEVMPRAKSASMVDRWRQVFNQRLKAVRVKSKNAIEGTTPPNWFGGR